MSAFDFGAGSNWSGSLVPTIAGFSNVGASDPVSAGIQNQGIPQTGLVTPGAVTTPAAAIGANLNPSATPLGPNLGTMNLALGGLQALGNIWSAWNANKLATKQFQFQKDVTNTNLANQIQSYNTTLEDRIRARAYSETGQSGGLQPGAQAQSYIDSHKLASRTIG